MLKNLLPLVLLFSLADVVAQPCIQNTHSLNFTGSSCVTFSSGNNLQMTNAVTIEAWINASAWGPSQWSNSIVCHHSSSVGGRKGYVLRAGSQGRLSFVIGIDSLAVGAWREVISPQNTLALNTWMHVAATFDGTMMRLYVNGIATGTLAYTGVMKPDTVYDMRIGRYSDLANAETRFFNGKIDEVRIWNRALSLPELQANHLTHLDPATQTGLVGYWRFNEGLGSSVTDLSTSGNNGTLSGAFFVTQVPFNQTAATPTIIPNGNLLTSTPAVTYQWNLNGVPINGATSQSWQAVAIGTYTVTVTDSLTCSATSGPYFVATVGMNELSDGSTFTIHQSEKNVSVTLQNSTGLDKVKVIDLSGKTVYENYTSGAMRHDIPVADFKSGIYIVVMQSKTGQGRSKFFINGQ